MSLVATDIAKLISIPESLTLLLVSIPNVPTVACLKNCLLLFLQLRYVSYGEENDKGYLFVFHKD